MHIFTVSSSLRGTKHEFFLEKKSKARSEAPKNILLAKFLIVLSSHLLLYRIIEQYYPTFTAVHTNNLNRCQCSETGLRNVEITKKESQIKRIIATKAVANKLARACYHILKDQVPFDVNKSFGRWQE